MTNKEIAELRRRLRADRHNITRIYGCYVGEKGEIISEMELSLGLMPQDEAEKYLALFKRTLSGPQHKNLIDITFRTAQVADSDEHRLLMGLRESGLKDESLRKKLWETVIPTIHMESNFVILLANDVYDVPYRAKDDAGLEDGQDVFSYILCAVCPVKLTKSVLHYVTEEAEFHNRATDFVVSPPEIGFLFPAFDTRRANIYNALFYTHNIKETNKEFVDAVFRTEPPMPAAMQKETFQSLLSDTLEEECSYELVQAVHNDLCDRMEAHKESRDPDSLLITRETVQDVLEAQGVSEEKLAAFHVRFDNEFGTESDLSPQNLINAKQLEVTTPDVVIKVNPERKDLVETRMIGGRPYILISAEEGVELNGVSISITE